jgi:hypothetical protein
MFTQPDKPAVDVDIQLKRAVTLRVTQDTVRALNLCGEMMRVALGPDTDDAVRQNQKLGGYPHVLTDEMVLETVLLLVADLAQMGDASGIDADDVISAAERMVCTGRQTGASPIGCLRAHIEKIRREE